MASWPPTILLDSFTPHLQLEPFEGATVEAVDTLPDILYPVKSLFPMFEVNNFGAIFCPQSSKELNCQKF